MKYIPLILSLLILAMAVMPCSDGHTCDVEGQEIPLEHDHSEDEKDHCSPFCVCPCCGININLPIKTIITQPLALLNLNYLFNYSNFYSFSFNQAVWRPPTFC